MKKQSKKIVLSAVAALAFGAISAGATFALFTSNARSDVNVASGKINVSLATGDLKLYSAKYVDGTGELVDENQVHYQSDDRTDEGTFINGGTATLNNNTLTLSKVTPGDKTTFAMTVDDSSNVNYKYRLSYLASPVQEDQTNSYITLVKNLNINAKFYDSNDNLLDSKNYRKKIEDVEDWALASEAALFDRVEVSVDLPINAGDENQDLGVSLSFMIEAVQGNAFVENDFVDNNYIATNMDELIQYAAIEDANVYVDFNEAENYLGVDAGDGISLTLANGTDVIGVTKKDGSLKQTITVVGGKDNTGFYSRIEPTGENCSFSNFRVNGKFAPQTTGWGRYPQVGLHVNNNKTTIDNCYFDGTGSNAYKFLNGSMKDVTIKNTTVDKYNNFVYAYLAQTGPNTSIPGYYCEFVDGGKLTIDNCIVTNISTYSLNAEGNGTFVLKDSRFCLSWSSYGNLAKAEFTNCTLNAGGYAKSRSYQPVSFTNCTFDESFTFDFGDESNGKHSFAGCKLGNVDITKEFILASSSFEATTDSNWKYAVDGEDFTK